jgi:hypothetical protein
VGPHACQTVAVLFKAGGPKKADSALTIQSKGLAFSVDNGVLRLERGATGGNLLDKVSLRGLELGELRPLIWQQTDGKDRWARTNEVQEVRIFSGPVRALIEITAAAKNPAETPETAPRGDMPYRCTYRLAVCPNLPYFTSQLVSVENTSAKSWTMRSYFHYATSNIGGNRDGDEPALKVPNYYLQIGVWGDEKVGAYYGVIAPAAEDCSAHFWTDKESPLSQHADARRAMDVRLLPGMKYAEQEPVFILFGVKKEGLGAPWAALAARRRASEAMRLDIRKPGWFW